MKKITTFGFIICTALGFAQSISVKEGNEKFSTGSQPAVITNIYENKLSEVIDEWKKVLKDYKNEKVKDKDNEVFGDNILVKDWGNNPVDFYTKFEEDKSNKTVKMAVAVDLGGTYLGSQDKDKVKYVENMVKNFAVRMTKAPVEDALKASEKTLSRLEDDQKDLEKDKKNLQEDIVNYKNKITKAEKDVVVKDGEIEKKKGEVAIQKKVVDASSGAVNEQAKSSQKIYDKLEDQLKDLEKDKKNLKGDIEDYNAKIKKAESDIKKNEEDQVKKKQEIENQKKVVEDTKKKLESVK
jgi:DNA repair exonuclease SbcCD ATPase subunit